MNRLGRRGTGALVLLVVLVMAVVLPGFGGRRIAGLPVVGPPPAPPAVGSCLAAPVQDELRSDGAGVRVHDVAALGPCTGAHHGEVVGVIDPAAAKSATAQDLCDRMAFAYLGLPAPGSLVQTFWTASSPVRGVLTSPPVLSRRFGEQWLGCVLPTPPISGRPTVHNAAVTYPMPGELLACTGHRPTPLDTWVSCDTPHVAEYLGSARLIPVGTGQRALDESCAALVATRTGLTDPTAGGQLIVQALSWHFDQAGNTLQGLNPKGASSASCLVQAPGPALLHHTVVAVGDHRLPIS